MVAAAKSLMLRTAALLALMVVLPFHVATVLIASFIAALIALFVVGGLASGLAHAVVNELVQLGILSPDVLSEINIPRYATQISAIITIGIGVAWLRTRFLLVYGIVELLVGAFVGVFNIEKFHPIPPFTDDWLAWLSVLGGVYIIVRGLDNIDKALPANEEARSRRFFDRYIVHRKPKDVQSPPNPVSDLWHYVHMGISREGLAHREFVNHKLESDRERAMSLNDLVIRLSSLGHVDAARTATQELADVIAEIIANAGTARPNQHEDNPEYLRTDPDQLRLSLPEGSLRVGKRDAS